MLSTDRPATRLATRLSFLVAGFDVAAWARRSCRLRRSGWRSVTVCSVCCCSVSASEMASRLRQNLRLGPVIENASL
jgi:hypothetical protein